jgi:adenine-specific DNA-methyltransferase
MGDVSQFTAIDAWRVALGLLPVPYRGSAESHAQWVLLNGTSGNFCLDFAGMGDPNAQRAAAWSCDVGHYVTFGNESVVVRRWGRGALEDKYSTQTVVAQIHDFHRYLERNTPDHAQSIVAHVLRVFRRLRAVENDGRRSLRALLHLLASGAAGQDRIGEAEFASWGLAAETIDITKGITDATWRPLYNDLSGIGRYDTLRPDFELVLRHASGAIFQDAHLEAYRSANLWIPGIEGQTIIDAKAVPDETGVYFTPLALARTLAEEATRNNIHASNKEICIFDPACGSGELLKECLRQLKTNGHTGPVLVVGWDKSPTAVDMSRFVLAWEARSWHAGQLTVKISEQDSLAADRWPLDVDILLMNPPFKSWQQMEPIEKEVLTRLLGASNKPNLAMAFASRALDALNSGGTLAMIIPNSVLDAASGKFLRERLSGALTPALIARLGDQSVFSRALVDAGIYVGRRKQTDVENTAVLWADSKPSSLNEALRGLRRWRDAEPVPITNESFSVYKRDDIGRSGSPWIARGYEAWMSYERVHNNRRTIPAKKLFDIKQGVRLGNDVFIVSKEYLERLDEREQRFFRPAVMNVSITNARLRDSHYVFYPYTTGLPKITTEEDLKFQVPTYYKMLLPVKEKLANRKSLAKAGLNWWELLWHRSWQEEYGPKIVSKYFGGARSFAMDREGKCVVVVGNAWLYEKGTMPILITDDEVYLATLAYLSSTIADGLLKYVSIQVSGGQADLSNKYVANLPILNLAR